jgi:Zn-dependent protease with chaperone function
MEHMAGASAPATKCPICEKPVYADSAGFLECACGWGGPGDPVESAHGFSRAVTLFDRRMASRIALRDLKRIAERKGPTSPRGPLYLLTLLVLSTLIYAALVALAVGAANLLVFYVTNSAWVAAILPAFVLFYLYTVIFGFPTRSRAIVAPLSVYPRLEALTREVAAQVKAQAPRWVVLTPGANFFIGRRMLWGKAFLPQTTLGVGVAGLALLSEQELRAILAHELAHDRYSHTLGSLYFGYAEQALYNIINASMWNTEVELRRNARSRVRINSVGSIGGAGAMLGVILIWIVTLPLRLLWVIYHLLRLRLSRSYEFRADAEAVRHYGAQEFVNGLTGVLTAAATLRGAGATVRQEMARHNNANFFAELRRHYAELPQDYIGEMRLKASREYRTLQSAHPTAPDRIRAALSEVAAPPPAGPSDPAWRVITPKGAASPEALEIELTKRFFP